MNNNKIFKKINFLVILIGLAFIFVGANSVNAQNLTAGGDSFETATAIQPGTYQVGSFGEGETSFYSFSGKAGQLVKIRWSGYIGITLYNADQEVLGDENGYSVGAKYENIWLPNSTKDNYTYYLKIYNDIFSELDPFALEVSLSDYYDADSKTDAGDTFNNALDVTLGDYQGHLAAEYMNSYGTDNVDYYKISVKKGVTYEFKVSPPTDGVADVELLNQKRELLDSAYSSNDGAVVSMFLTPVTNTNVFLTIKGNNYDNSAIAFDYDLSIKTSDSLNKFYACQDDYCQFVGEYSTLEDCQKENAKTCYENSDCDENCEGIIGGDLDEFDEEDTGLEVGSIVPGLMDKFPYQSDSFSFFKSFWKWAALYLILALVFYIYLAICLQALAKKTNIPNGWLAWIPVANIFLLLQIAQKPLWWFILLLIPIVNIIIGIILWMKIAERVNKPNWLGILIIVPVVGIVIPGYLAFSVKKK
ncbi:MAG TPA: DUF5684 domain-containing protein [bacterium]|nr:DUF5684 domain-containing protein [bacterium]